MKKAIGVALLVAWLWLKEAGSLLYKGMMIFTISLLVGGGMLTGAAVMTGVSKALAGVE